MRPRMRQCPASVQYGAGRRCFPPRAGREGGTPRGLEVQFQDLFPMASGPVTVRQNHTC